MSSTSTICAHLYDLTKSHNGQNVTVRLSDVDVLIIQKLEDADQILRLNADKYKKNMAWFRQTLGASRFSEDGHAWEIRKALSQSYFNKFDREKTFTLAEKYAFESLKILISDRDQGQNINDHALRDMTASIFIDNFFGVQLDESGIDMALLSTLLEYGSEYSFVPPGKVSPQNRATLMRLPELRRNVLKSLRYFRDEQCINSPLLNELLVADARVQDRVVLEQEFITFLAAGSETSAATMSWVCYLLARYPDIQNRLRIIAQEFWQSDQPSWKTLSTLRPLAAFVSEALRLYPPTPIVSRIATQADEVGETRVEAGQNVIISFIGIQHDQRFRQDPWQLDIDTVTDPRTAGHIVAFSSGPRVCGGKHFALVELITFLSVYLNKASFELTSDAQPVFHWKSQLLREGGQPVRVKWL